MYVYPTYPLVSKKAIDKCVRSLFGDKPLVSLPIKGEKNVDKVLAMRAANLEFNWILLSMINHFVNVSLDSGKVEATKGQMYHYIHRTLTSNADKTLFEDKNERENVFPSYIMQGMLIEGGAVAQRAKMGMDNLEPHHFWEDYFWNCLDYVVPPIGSSYDNLRANWNNGTPSVGERALRWEGSQECRWPGQYGNEEDQEEEVNDDNEYCDNIEEKEEEDSVDCALFGNDNAEE